MYASDAGYPFLERHDKNMIEVTLLQKPPMVLVFPRVFGVCAWLAVRTEK